MKELEKIGKLAKECSQELMNMKTASMTNKSYRANHA